jgi:hypothetical protein
MPPFRTAPVPRKSLTHKQVSLAQPFVTIRIRPKGRPTPAVATSALCVTMLAAARPGIPFSCISGKFKTLWLFRNSFSDLEYLLFARGKSLVSIAFRRIRRSDTLSARTNAR